MSGDAGAPAGSDAEGERIAKLMSRAGLCSRREAEAWIAARRVAVDGQVLDTPAVRVRPGQRVTVDGKPLPAAEPSRLFRYHKPKGVVTTARDPEGRTTLYDALPEGLPRLMPVGRLDIASEGLLLLTNDGALKRRLELPSTGWLRRYRARAYGQVDDRRVHELAHGATVEGVTYGPVQVKIERTQGDNVWLSVALREGKNREVRRALEHAGLTVNRLIRVAYGPFQLGSLPRREVEEVNPKVLREQVGALLALAPRLRPRRTEGQGQGQP